MIRRWTEADTPAVAKIERESFPDPWTEDMLAASLRNPAFTGLVWEENGEVFGYVGVVGADDGEIALIAVAKEVRKRGIGERLLSAAIDAAFNSGAENMFLEVRVSNLPARALYEKAGFIPIAVRKRYYQDGEDAVVMALEKKVTKD